MTDFYNDNFYNMNKSIQEINAPNIYEVPSEALGIDPDSIYTEYREMNEESQDTEADTGVDADSRYAEYRYVDNEHEDGMFRITQSEMALREMFRMLWEQHSVWTKLATMAIAQGSPAEELVVARLLRNPKDFEEALRPFYGDDIAAEFSRLLTEHLTIAAEIVRASKAGNNNAAEEAERRWYQNADEIAELLARINPNWNENDWKTMLHEHLELVKAQAVAILTSDYENSISIYDEMEAQALEMADMMSEGIIKQFPERFTE
ncbi:LysM peptidoglycan-binding domain-containing protein [Clostridium sp. Marseille-Q2269]|uniref:LysM peptidoglycan-binding domain-containing protein n=1 Tax=Clostridium sp. Marseille-Q2269 TaxID=2942205 RepID=UPI0020734484|nr:LysM peptidoglycan-binding domain-containing protein [Clostridium sp. Marseille-Q2269]